jgi:hypothetical protein
MYPDLPVIELLSGPARCVVADPRGAPAQLGARYVHGGYVLDLFDGDRRLTASPAEGWEPYKGRGLPEVFETGLGFSSCPDGGLFLRVGAGRIRREPGGDRFSAGGPLVEGLEWTVERPARAAVRMRCRETNRGHPLFRLDESTNRGHPLFRLRKHRCDGDPGNFKSMTCGLLRPGVCLPEAAVSDGCPRTVSSDSPGRGCASPRRPGGGHDPFPLLAAVK